MARSLCIYAATGGRKTTQVKYFSHYIARATGKSTLLLSLSDGGWEPMCTPEVRAGMIIPFKAEVTVTPLLLLRKISQGYWPKYPEEMGAAMQNISRVGPEPELLEKSSLTPINWQEIGGIAVEGWSSISEVIMRYLPDQGISVGGENRLGVNKNGVSMSFKQAVVVDGQLIEENFGSNTQGDYNFVQNNLAKLVSNFNSLPCHTVMYTALESKTWEEGDKTRTPVYGPAIAGKKATAHCGAWVGDLIHGQDYPVPVVVKVPNPQQPGEMMDQTIVRDTVRFFYRKHPDPDSSVMFPAKPRCAPEKILELEEKFPGGYFEPEFGATWGVDRYLEEVERLADDASRVESLTNWRIEADRKLGRVR